MNAPANRWLIRSGVVALLTGLAIAIFQQQSMQQLTAEETSLGAKVKEATRLRAENAHLAKLKAQSLGTEIARYEGSLKDLPKLRGEMQWLSKEMTKVEQVEQSLQRLKELNEKEIAARTQEKSVPGFVPKEQVRNAGFSTPENVLQTLLFAVGETNKALIIECFPLEVRSAFEEMDDQEFNRAASQFQAMQGYRIVESKPLPGNRQSVTVVLGAETNALAFINQNNRWYFATRL